MEWRRQQACCRHSSRRRKQRKELRFRLGKPPAPIIENLSLPEIFCGASPQFRESVVAWKALAPERLIAGHEFTLGDPYSADDIGEYFDQGGFAVLAEVGNQYVGAAANDPRFDDYWRVAEERDIPVGIHIGTGPPGAPYLAPGHRANLSSPLAEDVLIRHPKLRVYIMHAAWPMRDELLAMLYAHPQLYVDTGVLQLALAREEYYDYLRAISRAGFHERIMFGSDQMVWPGLIEEGIRAIEDAPFLTAQQKRDILYNNAARFLRLSDAEIARHRAMERSESTKIDPN